MKQTLQLGALSAVNIFITFMFQWYVLTQLGPGVETDALFAGMTLPQLVLTIISGSLMHVLVPLLAGEDEVSLRHDAWGFFFFIGGLFAFLAIGLYMTATWWVPLTVPGFDQVGNTLTIELTRIQLVGMVFTAVNGVQWAAYHARQKFIWAEFSPIISSTFSFLLLIWSLPKYGVIAAAWVSTLRMALQTLFLIPGMGKPIWPDFKKNSIVTAGLRIKPLLLGTAYYKTDPLVDRFLLSTSTSGTLSLFYLAQQIYGAINQVINKSIAAPLVPALSKLFKSKYHHEFRRVYELNLIKVGAICFFGLLVLGLAGWPILNLFVGHGNVGMGHIKELWWVMIWLGGMFVGGAMGQISSSAFYACGDTRAPTRMSVLTYTIYIPTKVVVFYCWGVFGLAITTSVYYVTNLLLQIHLINKKRLYENT